MRGKLSLLLLGLFLSIGSFAQSFTPSFEKEFLAQMFAQCPDSLKEDFRKMETSYSTYKFKEIRSIEQMKKFYQKKYKDNPEVIGYITDEVNAYVRHGDGESNLRVDFYYVDQQDTLNCFRINNDYGTLSKSFVTKSGKRYELRHAWGLAAYFDADIRQDKKQIEKCKNIFNKIPAQSEKVLENKGFPYVDRFLEKYCQKLLKSELGLRYYFTKPQSLQQASSQTTYGLTLNISKPVYEKGENISLLFQWYEDNADCKVLEEKVKETLKENQLEIIENGLTCSKDAKATTIKLSVQVKASNVGQYSIPPIELEDVLSNGISFFNPTIYFYALS